MNIFCKDLRAESNRQIYAELCSKNYRNQHFTYLLPAVWFSRQTWQLDAYK